MKVLHVIESAYGSPNTAGTIWLCVTLANSQLNDINIDKVGVVTNIDNASEVFNDGVEIEYTECRGVRVVGPLLEKAVEVYKNEQYDIIHVHLAKIGAIRYIARLTRDPSVRMMYTVHNLVNIGLPSHSVVDYAKEITNRSNVCIVGPSKFANNEWRNYVGQESISNLYYIYNGVKQYPNIDYSKPHADRKYDLVVCGRLVEMKNARQCIEFLKLNPDIKALYIGTTDKSTSTRAQWYTNDCKDHMEELLSSNPNVTWMQEVSNDEVVNLFSDSKILLTLGMETFGLTVAEAMSAGTMILSHNNGAVPELVSDTSGLIVDLPNRKKWTTKHKIIREKYDELLHSHKDPENIRKEFETRFLDSIMCTEYSILYDLFIDINTGNAIYE